MIRINLDYLLGVAERLFPLTRLELVQTRVVDIFQHLSASGATLIGIYGEKSLYRPHLRLSLSAADRLFESIDKHVQAFDRDASAEVSPADIAGIQDIYRDFKVVFQADLASVNAYLVSPRKPFDLTTMLTDGPSLFPPGMVSKAPETKPDAEEAGKALAFELGTACGFHVFRVTEAVLKRYWDRESGGAPRPKLETIGTYASELEGKGFGDRKVIESLKMLARLHRNPIIHPEYILTVDEALDTIGIARSVVSSMLKALPEIPPSTGLVASEVGTEQP